MIVYNIEFYACLPKIGIYFFLHFDLRSDPDPHFFESDSHFSPSGSGSVEKNVGSSSLEKTAQLCWTELKVMVVGRQKSNPKVYAVFQKWKMNGELWARLLEWMSDSDKYFRHKQSVYVLEFKNEEKYLKLKHQTIRRSPLVRKFGHYSWNL